MSHALKNYQSRSVERLKKFLDLAQVEGPGTAFEKSVESGLTQIYKAMPGLPSVPYVCLRIPTGGGKTIMGAHVIKAARGFLDKPFPMVLWMVPTTQIKNQTLEAFQTVGHPYRQALDDAFDGKVAIFDVGEFTQIRPADLGTKVVVVLSTVAALRRDEKLKEGLKVYSDHEDLDDHFSGEIDALPYLEKNGTGRALHSFENLCRLHRPLILMDEAHNAVTPLSHEVYERLAPKAVVEMTATPRADVSNLLVSVSAFELKREDMIKFPLVLKEHQGEWEVAVSAAVARRKSLATDAKMEADYVRPILLIQAESKGATATVEAVKKHLLEVDKVPVAAIAVATGETRGIDGVNLFANDCPIEIIITKQALKEGWDCSFAYVFCSVAQVKSDKDIQQLLGRVLRMPYATKRTQESMSRAYAHVITDDFGKAASELTDSLIKIGFNPLEAAAAIRRDVPAPKLPLEGGRMNPVALPKTRISVPRQPDLTNIPARDAGRVVFVEDAEGAGGVIEIEDEIDVETVKAIAAVAPEGEKRRALEAKIELHQNVTAAAKAPSERGAVFQVPRLYFREEGQQPDLIQPAAVPEGFQWDLLAQPADVSTFAFRPEEQTYEVFLDGLKVQYHMVKDDVATYLPGFAQDRTLADLVGWLTTEIRIIGVKQPPLLEWVRRGLQSLIDDRGFSLAQLLRSQFVLRAKLEEELELSRAQAYTHGFHQALLFPQGHDVVSSNEPDHAFTYPADMTLYPAHSYYEGTYKFRRHYYPGVGDLRWKTGAGVLGEEFQCARVIDELEDVEFWVRNLVHPSQFWMPTSRMRTYPDFVLKLNDGRLFVVEFKGGDRYELRTEAEKRMVGELWEQKSGGRGIYLMAQMTGGRADSVRDQLLAKIRT